MKKQLPMLAAAIAFLVMFVSCEYLRRQPDAATRELEEVLKRHEELKQSVPR